MVTELSQALTLDEQAQLQERLMLLLASRVRYATQGDSSSVSQEYAQALLEGVVFALQTHLQAQGLPARALLEPPLQALYEEALSTLQGLLDQVRALYLRACETAPVFPNRALHDTLQAIEGFLGKYDYRMFPQDSHCTLDYPLCLPIAADLQGVRRIHAYLQHLCLENAFLLRFPPDAQARVYHALSPDPRDLLINLYECAADQALGCMLCGGDLQSLTLGANGHAVLVQRLAPLTLPDLSACLAAAAQDAADRLHMTAPAERQYLQGAAIALSPRLHAALGFGSVRHIFS